MNIVIFIKQVPDTNDVKWTHDNNIDRTRMESILNPLDRQAIEAAIELKDKYNAHTTAVTMGPKKSLEVLQEAVAMGIDDGILLCDSKFAASDTWATSNVLSAAAKELLPETDLFLFGQCAIDGETSQTGPSVATRLNIPFLSQVKEIIEISSNIINVISEDEISEYYYNIKMPCALFINNYIHKPRLPIIEGYINSQTYQYKSYSMAELRLTEDKVGLSGSPTSVVKVYKNSSDKNCKIIHHNNNTDYTDFIIELKNALEN